MALTGTNGDDNFNGTSFADEIFGLGGDDYIGGSRGADTINGGADIDTVDYFAFYAWFNATPFPGDAVNVDLARSVQFGGLAEGDVLLNIENVVGSQEDDFIYGDNQDNELDGAGGNDFVEGRGGDDLIRGDGLHPNGGLQADHLDGGEGDDIVFGHEGNDTIIGGRDNDELLGGPGNDLLLGDHGIDVLDGEAGVDTASYTNSPAAVTVSLNVGAVGIGIGGDAAGDTLFSIENVIGSAFADTLTGSASANVLFGGSGNDTLDGRAGGDTLNGNFGTDTVSYAASAASVFVDLASGDGSGGDAQGDELISIENLIGSSQVDILWGDAGGNTLDGRAGADVLVGRTGNDTYIVDNAGDGVLELGGEGNDTVRTSVSYTLGSSADIETLRTTDDNGTSNIDLVGNVTTNTVRGNGGANLINGAAGNDTLTGLGGADAFLFNTALDASTNIDVVTDFSVADDTIRLDNDIFVGLAAGTLAANRFAIGAAAQDATDRIIYDDETGALFFDSDGTGPAAQVQFAEVSIGLALTRQDFLVV